MKHLHYIVFLLCLTACSKQAPQIPSQRTSKPAQENAEQTATKALNQQLALTADEEVQAWVALQTDPYQQGEANTWIYVSDEGDPIGAQPATDEVWTVHMRIYDLAGQLLTDTEKAYRIGKKELPAAVDKNIGAMHRGAKARIVTPWYSAFGLTGTAEIAPYENLVIEIELK